MGKVAVVTDSVACIPRDLVEKYGIHVAPVHINYGKELELRDNVDITPEEFYGRLRKMGKNDKLPTTSSGIAGEFVRIFESLRGHVDGAVVIALTGALGAAYSTALTAKEMVPELPVEVVDTRTAMCAQGFVAVAAAKAAQNGAGLAEVKAAAEAMVPKVKIYWAMETLEYLRRGGRVSMPAAVLAGWLKVKPMLTISAEGKVEPVAKPRTMAKALEQMLKTMAGKVGQTPLHAAIVHGDVPAEAENFKRMVVERFKPVETWMAPLTPVIGTHTGPGTLGVAFYNE